MCRVLAHRGPDGQGIESGDGWILGHRRLSIIDLSDKARQPMVNEDGTVKLVHNGEIYNCRDLRCELQSRGHVFVSGADSEVILHLYEEEGMESVRRLNGIFAYAIVDTRRSRLVLGRDHLGVKPLYYAGLQGVFAFASEIKALFCLPGLVPRVNRDRIRECVQYRYLAGGDSLFEGVHPLPPGCVMEMDLSAPAPAVRRYWSPGFYREEGSVGCHDIAEQLERSVRAQLMSDVPVGVQLSGGLDSSVVTMLAARHLPHPLHTVSVSLRNTPNDESAWADLVSQRAGTIHHVVPYSQADFVDDLAMSAYLHDDPLNHPSSPAMCRMCVEAKKHLTVFLTGEGADELFGGYSWHRRAARLKRWGPVAGWPLWRIAAGLVRPRSGYAGFSEVVGRTAAEIASGSGRWVCDTDAQQVLAHDLFDGAAPGRGIDIADTDDPLAAVLNMDLRTYLVSVLQKQDRMSMGSGIESRVPFLDPELVDLAVKLPAGALFDADMRGKAVLRSIAETLVPREIVHRTKLGFRMPMSAWMRAGQPLGRLLDWLVSGSFAGSGAWRPERVKAFIDEHRQGKRDHSDLLWSLLAMEIWSRLWIERIPCDTLREHVRAATRNNTPTGREREVPGRESGEVRVCHVVSSLAIGGMERVVCSLLTAERCRGHKTFLFCIDSEGALYGEADADAKACANRRDASLFSNRHVARELSEFVLKHGIGLIHAHNSLAHLYGTLASLRSGCPVVATYHGQGYRDTWRTFVMRRGLMLRTAIVTAVSEDVRGRLLGSRSAPESKIRVITNGVDVERFRPVADGAARRDARRRCGVPAEAFVVGSIGRFSYEKNYPALLRAVAGMRRGVTCLALVGDGPERPALARLVLDLGLEGSVVMPGMQQDVLPWLWCMDVFCLPSLTEGTSISLLKAGACGIPSVVSNVGGNPEVVEEGVTGFVVPAEDELALADALVRLGRDGDLRKRMGLAARERVERMYGAVRMAREYMAIYEEVVGKREAIRL